MSEYELHDRLTSDDEGVRNDAVCDLLEEVAKLKAEKEATFYVGGFESYIKERFKGYHISISLTPVGGIVDAQGCEECGTSEDDTFWASWKTPNSETLETALDELERKIKQ